MGLQDKAENTAEGVKGKAKEHTGRATDDKSMENEGKVDQGKAGPPAASPCSPSAPSAPDPPSAQRLPGACGRSTPVGMGAAPGISSGQGTTNGRHPNLSMHASETSQEDRLVVSSAPTPRRASR